MGRRIQVLLLIAFLAAFLAVPPAVASEKEPVELSLKEAIFRALYFSKSVEKAELDIEKAEDARSAASGAVLPTYYISYTPGTESLIFAAESAEFGYRSSQKSYDLTCDTVVLDVYSRYYAVLKAQEKVAAKEAALKALEKKLAVTQAMVHAGLATRTAIIGLEAQLAGAQAALAGAQSELDQAYVAFNQLVVLKPDERPVLTDTVTFTPLEADENTCAAWATGENPTVWIARYAVEYKQTVQNYDTGDPNTVITDEDARKAELDAESAEEAAALLGRKLYHGVKSLEAAYAAALEGVAAAEENLRVTRVKFEAGLATSSEVVAAEADLTAARQNLFDLAAQHAYMKLAVEKPWAYLAVLAQSSGSTATTSGSSG